MARFLRGTAMTLRSCSQATTRSVSCISLGGSQMITSTPRNMMATMLSRFGLAIMRQSRSLSSLTGGDDGEADEPWKPGDEAELVAPPVVPEEYPELVVLPMDSSPLFPRFLKVMTITDKKLMRKIQELVKTRRPWCVALTRRERPLNLSSVTDVDEVFEVGTFCHIKHSEMETDGSCLKLLVEGHRRVEVTGLSDEDAEVLTVMTENIKMEEYDREDDRIKAYGQEIIKTLRDIVALNPMHREHIHQHLSGNNHQTAMQDPPSIADFAAAVSQAEPERQQKVLEERNVQQRLEDALHLVKEELVRTRLQNEISQQVEDKIKTMQREHMLQEQLKVIKRELGITKDDKDAIMENFREKLEDLQVPEQARKVIDEEMEKFGFLDKNSSEFNVTRNYLDWLTALPWGKTTEDNLDLDNAQICLDEDHYGMKDAKDRVLEFMAVGKLKGSVQGKILCFVGPPGVGKTSIAKSIARALDREFYRFSVGGLHDVAEIKGHRRTYVGAMPGKTIQCLKKTQSENPLILIDEIDKISRGTNGDPTSAMLELLDPEQNANFLDHYLDAGIMKTGTGESFTSAVSMYCKYARHDSRAIIGPDGSNSAFREFNFITEWLDVVASGILFPVTGFDLQLHLYMLDEKVAIAQEYLIPAASNDIGASADDVIINTHAVSKLIKGYCRESGVRNLQKHIEKVFRKAAVKIIRDDQRPVSVDEQNLTDFVGNPIFTSDRMYESTPPGVVMGLAYTQMGGATLYFETVQAPRRKSESNCDDTTNEISGRGSMSITGQLGDVMKESSQIAYSVAKRVLHAIQPNNFFFDSAEISMHVPEGATPKDGPSAGITMVTALLSLAMDRPVLKDLAMTGEVSLTGKVLKVGGIKEKLLAAKRAAAKRVIMPEGCRADYEELPDGVKEGLEVLFVSNYEEVYTLAFDRNDNLIKKADMMGAEFDR